jgi:hypothetical protein
VALLPEINLHYDFKTFKIEVIFFDYEEVQNYLQQRIIIGIVVYREFVKTFKIVKISLKRFVQKLKRLVGTKWEVYRVNPAPDVHPDTQSLSLVFFFYLDFTPFQTVLIKH